MLGFIRDVLTSRKRIEVLENNIHTLETTLKETTPPFDAPCLIVEEDGATSVYVRTAFDLPMRRGFDCGN